jgi:hypothetical protein
MKSRIIQAFCVLVCLVLVVPALKADDNPTIYTRVGQWKIAPQFWDEFEKSFEKYELPVLEKLLADGSIVEYGFDTAALHSEEGPTHGTWIASKNMVGIEKALEALNAAEMKLSPEIQKKLSTDLFGEKHSDALFSSLIIKGRTAQLNKGYDATMMVQVQPGKKQEYKRLFEKYYLPVVEGLYANGTITSYGLDEEDYHSHTPGILVAWYVVSSAEGLDKFNEAFENAWKSRSEAENSAIQHAIMDLTVPSAHRDSLSRILHYGAKY